MTVTVPRADKMSAAKEKQGEFVVGNFVIGEFALDVKCRLGHEVRFYNLGQSHYFACDTCRTYIFCGIDLLSSWQHENQKIWNANYKRIKNYKRVG